MVATINKPKQAKKDYTLSLSVLESKEKIKELQLRLLLEEEQQQTPFDPRTQIYPADLFILEGFDFRRQPIWVRNPRWHDDKGYFIGRSK